MNPAPPNRTAAVEACVRKRLEDTTVVECLDRDWTPHLRAPIHCLRRPIVAAVHSAPSATYGGRAGRGP